MMSKRLNLFVISLIMIAMVGLPVYSAIRAALHGSGTVESLMKNGVERYKDSLPIELDQYITLTHIDWDKRQFIYDFNVNVGPKKLLEMQDYFQRKSQFNYCHLENYLSFETYGIQTVERYTAEGHDGPSFSITANSIPCKTHKRTADGYVMTPDVVLERRLNAEYLSFFLPLEISENLSIVSLTPPPHGMVEHKSSGAVLVGMADSLGAEILVEFCDKNDNSRYKIYVKPSDKNDPIFSFNISAEICRSGIPEYSFLTESDVRSLEVMRELMTSK